ncbi:hypothetical protein [Nonomuraea insulae]|uniref:Apea-like HEPN domain-containing protein n=1 Tax=Nonomuraea insulae TaxID=1616787 RepID=A0ABW1CT33_9ACTN
MVILNPPFSVPPTWLDELRMTMSRPAEAWCDPIHTNLIATAKELDAWLRQMPPYKGIQRQGWLCLLKDFEHSATNLGPEVAQELGGDLASAVTTAQSLHALFTLRRYDAAATPFAARRGTDSAIVTQLVQQLEGAAVRRAAWRDLVAVCQDTGSCREIIAWRRDFLWDLFRLTKYDPDRLMRSFLDIIADDEYAVIDAQVWLGERNASAFDAHPSPMAQAGLTESARLALCERLAAAPAVLAHHVVWFAYTHASIHRLDLGPLSFYNSEWVRGNLEHGGPFLHELPKELTHPDSWFQYRDLPKAKDTALVRVDLDKGNFADPVQSAREQAEATITLAGFRQGDVTWHMMQGYLHSVNGHISGIGTFRPPHDLDKLARPAHFDNMSDALKNIGPKLGPHLPLRDAMLAEVIDALRDWQEATRQSPLSAILLNVRIMEFLAARTGHEKWYLYLEEYHALSWVWAHMHRELHNTVHQALYSKVPGISEADEAEVTRLQQAVSKHHGDGYTADLRQALAALPTLTRIFTLREQFGRRLHTLAGRLSSPTAVAIWGDELREQWTRSLERLQRVRNALAHGNPIEPMTAHTIHLYSQRLAATSLSISIDGLLDSSSSLVAEHDKNRDKAAGWFSSVQTAATVEDALFVK